MKYLFLLLLISSLFSACKKNKTSQDTIVPIDADLKAAFNFKHGSYWIYKDSLTGQIDSFFVTQNDSGAVSGNYTNDGFLYYSGITMTVHECKIFPNTDTSTQVWQYYIIANTFNINYADSNIEYGNILYEPVVNFPFSTILAHNYGRIPFYDDTGVVLGIFTNYVISGNMYPNVAITRHYTTNRYNNSPNPNLPNPFSYNDFLFITPNIGLIKIVQNHPQDSIYHIWELQRYNIVK